MFINLVVKKVHSVDEFGGLCIDPYQLRCTMSGLG